MFCWFLLTLFIVLVASWRDLLQKMLLVVIRVLSVVGFRYPGTNASDMPKSLRTALQRMYIALTYGFMLI